MRRADRDRPRTARGGGGDRGDAPINLNGSSAVPSAIASSNSAIGDLIVAGDASPASAACGAAEDHKTLVYLADFLMVNDDLPSKKCNVLLSSRKQEGMAMRAIYLVTTLFAVLICAPAQAQTPSTLLAGSTQPNYNGGQVAWCGVEARPGSFQRMSNGPVANIGIDGLYYTFVNGTNQPSYYLLSGQATLTFTNSTSGTIAFPYPASYPTSVRTPNFSDYQQNYDPVQNLLNVTFAILFQNCALRVNASYRQ